MRNLIKQQPVEPYARHGQAELLEVHGFHDVMLDAELAALQKIFLLMRGGEHDHRNRPGLRVGLDAFQHIQPIYFRQPEVEQNYPGSLALALRGRGSGAEEKFQRFGSVPDSMKVVAKVAPFQGMDGQLGLHHQPKLLFRSACVRSCLITPYWAPRPSRFWLPV